VRRPRRSAFANLRERRKVRSSPPLSIFSGVLCVSIVPLPVEPKARRAVSVLSTSPARRPAWLPTDCPAITRPAVPKNCAFRDFAGPTGFAIPSLGTRVASNPPDAFTAWTQVASSLPGVSPLGPKLPRVLPVFRKPSGTASPQQLRIPDLVSPLLPSSGCPSVGVRVLSVHHALLSDEYRCTSPNQGQEVF